MSKNTKFKDYVLDIFAVEQHKEDNKYVVGFGFKDDDDLFSRKNFQLHIKKECSLEELYKEFLQMSIAIKEVINNEAD